MNENDVSITETETRNTVIKHAKTSRTLLYAFSLIAGMAILTTGALFLREFDLNRIKSEQVENNTEVIEHLDRATRVLCDRGYILIDLINGSLVLIGQRLEADIKKGEAAAVRADQKFLTKFITNREVLTRELTNPESPCAVP